MKLHKISLLTRILIAIILGIGAGFVFPEALARIFVTINSIFSELLGFFIPLIIIGFVAPSIAEIGSRAGKMLIVTALLAYGMTLFAGFSSYFVSNTFFPSLISHHATTVTNGVSLSPYFSISIPSLMNVMTALVLAFTLGLGCSRLSSKYLQNTITDFREIINLAISKIIIPLLPLYIFGIFMNMTISGEVGGILLTFIKIIAIIFALHIGILILQYCIASMFCKKNPFKMLITMLPAYFTALGTQSSAATIPITLKQSIKTGVREDIGGFVIPLCATIHMSGSTLKIVACALALMLTNNIAYDFPMFAGFICMLGITIVAAPGVPGGAIMASLGLLSSMLGFSEADNALMIALYIAMDSFGTACNVTGDGAIALIINNIFKSSDNKSLA